MEKFPCAKSNFPWKMIPFEANRVTYSYRICIPASKRASPGHNAEAGKLICFPGTLADEYFKVCTLCYQ